eukprot:2624565-Amphidinium_carterae.1
MVGTLVMYRLALIGEATTCLVQSRWIRGTPTTPASKRSKPLYNPSRKLSGHCFYACLCFAILQRTPTRTEIDHLRNATANLWQYAPAAYLDEVALRAGLTPEAYIKETRNALWGGLPELLLLSHVFDVGATLDTQLGDIHASPYRGITVRHADDHFTLLHASAHGHWRKLAFLLRDKKGNSDKFVQLDRAVAFVPPTSSFKGLRGGMLEFDVEDDAIPDPEDVDREVRTSTRLTMRPSPLLSSPEPCDLSALRSQRWH